MANGQKLKIGFVFDDSLDSNDGVAQNVKIFGGWLNRQGYEVSYLVGQTKIKEWAGGKVYSLSKNQKVSFNGNQARIPLPASKKRIKALLKNNKFDVLHVQMPHSPFMAQKVINAAGKDVTIVGTFHVAPSNALGEIGGRLLKLTYLKGLKRFDRLMSVSSAAASYAKSAFGVDTEILPNVVEYDKFIVSAKKVKKDPNKILFFGRLVKRKGALELLRAFKILSTHNPKTKLTIAGAGPELNSLKSFVRENNLTDKVKFLGFIEEKDKPELLAGAAIACFPSTGGESFGVSLLEAMIACQGVIVAGDNPGYRSVLKDRPELLVDPKNPLALAGRISEFLDSPSKARELQEWQKAEARQYDVNEVGKELVKLYRASIAKHALKADN